MGDRDRSGQLFLAIVPRRILGIHLVGFFIVERVSALQECGCDLPTPRRSPHPRSVPLLRDE